MKKTLALLLMLLLCAGLVLTACGGGASSAAPASTAPAPTAAPAAAKEDVEEDFEEDYDDDVEEDDFTAQVRSEVDAMVTLFEDAYYGMSTDGDEAVMLIGPDVAAIAFVNGTQSASFVGEYTAEDTAMTIVDETNGLQITFIVEEDGDGFWLDIGDVGDVYVEQIDLEDGILAMLAISHGTEAVL